MRPLVLIAGLCLVAVVVAGCGSGATTNCRVPPDRDLLLAVRAHAGAVKLPSSTESGNAGRLTITACQTSGSEATATLTVFSLSDTSTRDIRHGMKLEKRGAAWVLAGDAHSRRCQKGHGSQEFSNARCT